MNPDNPFRQPLGNRLFFGLWALAALTLAFPVLSAPKGAIELAINARHHPAFDLAFRYLTFLGGEFLADYATLGAQRNAKIVGIFVRLWRRDGKPRYLSLIPRVWRLLERDLMHPALAPVAAWFDQNIPRDVRDADGGTFAA